MLHTPEVSSIILRAPSNVYLHISYIPPSWLLQLQRIVRIDLWCNLLSRAGCAGGNLQ